MLVFVEEPAESVATADVRRVIVAGLEIGSGSGRKGLAFEIPRCGRCEL
jgi:hypothetical protein